MFFFAYYPKAYPFYYDIIMLFSIFSLQSVTIGMYICRCMTCWSCTIKLMFLLSVCCSKFLQLGKWVSDKIISVVNILCWLDTIRPWLFCIILFHWLLGLCTGNRGFKITGIWGHTDTFDICVQVSFLQLIGVSLINLFETIDCIMQRNTWSYYASYMLEKPVWNMMFDVAPTSIRARVLRFSGDNYSCYPSFPFSLSLFLFGRETR